MESDRNTSVLSMLAWQACVAAGEDARAPAFWPPMGSVFRALGLVPLTGGAPVL